MELLNTNRNIKLTILDKMVIKVISNDPLTVLKMSIDEIALQCLTTKSSIVKTLQKIGISGYKELKQIIIGKLNEESKEYLSSSNRIISKLISTEVILNKSKISEVANLVCENNEVLIIASEDTYSLTKLLVKQLNPKNLVIKVISVLDVIPKKWKDKTIIFLSLSGINQNIYKVAKKICQHNEIISLTASETSNISEYAKYKINGNNFLVDKNKIKSLVNFDSIFILTFIFHTLVSECLKILGND